MKYLQRQECDGGELEGRQKTVAHSHGNIQHQSEEETQQVTGQSGQLLAPGLASLLAGDWLGVDPVLQQVPGASPVGDHEGRDHTGGPEEICQ